MSNKVAMNEKRANGLLWRTKEGKFKASTCIDKKFLGLFCVDFELNPANGETAVEIKNPKRSFLRQEKTCHKDFNGAIACVNSYFEGIDELIKKLPFSAIERAQAAYDNVISNAIMQ